MWDSYFFGTVQVGASAIGLNQNTLRPLGSPPAAAVLIQVQSDTAAIRFRHDGGTPTAASGGGIEAFPGRTILITGAPDLKNFLAIRRENEVVNPILQIIYMR